jgi:hypothetical protein
MPYTGTGTFVVSAGFKKYTVTDANGCSDQASLSVPNGTLTIPSKPSSITGAAADGSGLCGGGDFSYSVSVVSGATSYTWIPPSGCTVSNASGDASVILLHAPPNFDNGTLSVYATNVCGNSNKAETKTLYAIPAKPGPISGPASVTANQSGLKYSVPSFPGVTYVWTVPGKATITAGQNTPNIAVTWGSTSGNVTVSATNSCGASTYKSGLYVTVTTAASAMQTQAVATVTTGEMMLQPNPVKTIAYLSFNAEKQYNFTIQLFDLKGKVLLEKTGVAHAGLNRVLLDVGRFASGLYMVHLNNGGPGMKTMKLIKE